MSEQGPTVFNGRYELLRHIARGGMADVYLARDDLLDREVALKVLFPEFANDPNFVERFRREAQAAANLNHPNIVGIYDWGQERGTYYIVMEHVSGRSMSDVLRSTGPLSGDRAAEIASDVAAALATAHSAGLVHRDIKLGNILVSDEGAVKVADFGIATALVSGAEAGLTQHGSVMGTATYFSPEQAQGKTLDGRSDLYSLGVVLYEMLAGTPPFTAETPVGVAYKHVQERPASMADHGVQVAASLNAITMKLLAKNPINRYPTANDLRSDLRRYLAGAHGVPAGGAAVTPAANPATDQTAAVAPVPAAVAPAADPGATTAQPVTPGAAAPSVSVGADPNPAAYGQAAYYYEEQPSDSRWKTGALIGSLAVLIVVLGFLFASFLNVFGGSEGEAEETGDLIDVPSVEGLDIEDARAALANLGLNFTVEFEPNNDVSDNVVFAQNPPAGERVEAGTEVLLQVSSGVADTVPNVISENRESATSILQGLGYVVVEVTTANPQEAGTVIAQNPPSGSPLVPGETVEITVSSGPDVLPIPDLEGAELIAAINQLNSEGFSVSPNQITESSESIPEGRVIRTEPAAGNIAAVGSQVSIVVSSGTPTVAVPAITDLFSDTAVQTLRNAGLEPITVFEDVPAGSSSIGRVIAQSPAAFEEVEIGTVVTVTVGQPAPETTTTTTTTTAAPDDNVEE